MATFNSQEILKPDEQEYLVDGLKNLNGLLSVIPTELTDNANHKFTTVTSSVNAGPVGEGGLKPIGGAGASSINYKAHKFVARIPITDESADPKTVGIDIETALQPDVIKALNNSIEGHLLGIINGTKQSSGATVFERDLVNNKTLADTELVNISHDGLRVAASQAAAKIETVYAGQQTPDFILLPGDARGYIRDARATNDSDRSLYGQDSANTQNVQYPLYFPEVLSTNLATLGSGHAANRYVGMVGVRNNFVVKILDDIKFEAVRHATYTDSEGDLRSTSDYNEILLIWEMRLAFNFKKTDQFAFIKNTEAEPTPPEG